MQDLKDLKRFFRGSNARGGNPLGCAYGIRGPRATVKTTPSLHVGRGPVPRHASIERKTAWVCVWFSRGSNVRGGQAPALRKKTPSLTVGRGPVPRHAALAGDRPPPYGEKTPSLHVGRGPVPRHRACTRLCKSGSPDPDPFVIRRSQTTEVGPC